MVLFEWPVWRTSHLMMTAGVVTDGFGRSGASRPEAGERPQVAHTLQWPGGCERLSGPACTAWACLFATVTHRLSSWVRASSLKVHRRDAAPTFLRPCLCSVRSRSSTIVLRLMRHLEESTRSCQEGKADVIWRLGVDFSPVKAAQRCLPACGTLCTSSPSPGKSNLGLHVLT